MNEVLTVDLDEVVVHTAQLCLDRYEAVYGVRVPLYRYYDGDVPKWGGDAEPDIKIETVTSRLNEFIQSEEYLSIPPDPEAVEALGTLSEKHKLWAVTGRPFFVERATQSWLTEYLPGVFDGLVHTSHYLEGHQRRRTKLEVCSELGAVALIDDLLDHLVPLVGSGITPILHGKHPWTEAGTIHPEIVRAETWQEVVGYIDGRS